MSAPVASRFPSSFTETVDYKQLIKTTHAMKWKKGTMISIGQFNGLKKACVIKSFNSSLHKRMIYQILKSISSVVVGVITPHTYRLPRFPKFNMYSSKQMVIRKIGNLPIEIIHIINDYAFERFDEVRYSLFYLSVEIYRIFELNVSIITSVTRKTLETTVVHSAGYDEPLDVESWVWVNDRSSLRMSARNCCICGGYKTTNTLRVSPRIICHCNTLS